MQERQEHELELIEKKKIIKDTILNGQLKDIVELINMYHEADIAEVIEELPHQDRLTFFRFVKPVIAAEIFEETDISIQLELIKDFKILTASKILKEMYPDDVADLLGELSEEDKGKAIELLEMLPPEDSEDVTELLTYPEDSAGGLMTTDYISIPENLNVKEALEKIKELDPPNSEVSFFIYIVDDNDRLVGMTTLRNLLMHTFKENISDIRKENIIHVYVDMDQEEVARTIAKYDLYAVPVIDQNQKLLGIITADDVMDVVEEEVTEDIYKLSGTSDIEEEKLLHGKLVLAVRSRIPWLLLTVVGGFISAALINHYTTNVKYLINLPILMSFVPLLMGIGGNVGNQSCTIVVRGIATGHIKKGENLRLILRESMVGGLIGMITGTVTSVLAFTWRRDPMIGFIVGIAMWANITTAAIIGTTLPLIFRRVGIDPAVASAPFISTTIDITGLVIYFSFVTTLTILFG